MVSLVTPIQSIKEGIVNKDWNLVIVGFHALTGEDLAPKYGDSKNTYAGGYVGKPDEVKKKRGRPKKVTVITSNDNETLSSTVEETENEVEVQSSEDNRIMASTRQYTKPKKVILFCGDKTVDADEAKLIKEDKKWMKQRQPRQRRQPVKYMKLTCAKCKNKVNIEEELAAKYGDGTELSEKPTFFCEKCVR